MLYAILKPIAVVLMRLLFRLEARGTEHVPAQRRPCSSWPTTSSVLDPPLVGGVAPRPLTFLAKAELFDIPLFGAADPRRQCAPPPADGADAGALPRHYAGCWLEEGRALLVFPGGHARAGGRAARGRRPGRGCSPSLSGAPVVPVYITGSGAALAEGPARSRGRPRSWSRFGPAADAFERATGVERKAHYEATSRAIDGRHRSASGA